MQQEEATQRHSPEFVNCCGHPSTYVISMQESGEPTGRASSHNNLGCLVEAVRAFAVQKDIKDCIQHTTPTEVNLCASLLIDIRVFAVSAE